MAGIFLCYRREDTRWCAGRLHDLLSGIFGRGAVFWDVHSIGGGEKFKEETGRRVSQSDVVLVLIGKRWLEANSSTDRPRIEDAEDFVREELSLALGAQKHVVPVLVDDAELPHADSLPPSLRELVERHAVHLRFSQFQNDVAALVACLKPKVHLSPASRATLGFSRMRAAAFVSCLAVGAAGGFGLSYMTSGETPREDLDETMAREDTYQASQRQLWNKLEGYVETSDGRRIAKATVSATVRGRSREVRTVTDGSFALDISTLEPRSDDEVLVRAVATGHGENELSFLYKDGWRRHRFTLVR